MRIITSRHASNRSSSQWWYRLSGLWAGRSSGWVETAVIGRGGGIESSLEAEGGD